MQRLNLTWLKRARYRRRMTVEQAAEVIGKDRSAIWRYESGKTDIPVHVLCQLLDAYKTSVTEVFVNCPAGGDAIA